MRVAVLLIGAIASLAMATPTQDDRTQELVPRDVACPCRPNCGCGTPGLCYCLKANNAEVAPCYPTCGCTVSCSSTDEEVLHDC